MHKEYTGLIPDITTIIHNSKKIVIDNITNFIESERANENAENPDTTYVQV